MTRNATGGPQGSACTPRCLRVSNAVWRDSARLAGHEGASSGAPTDGQWQGWRILLGVTATMGRALLRYSVTGIRPCAPYASWALIGYGLTGLGARTASRA